MKTDTYDGYNQRKSWIHPFLEESNDLGRRSLAGPGLTSRGTSDSVALKTNRNKPNSSYECFLGERQLRAVMEEKVAIGELNGAITLLNQLIEINPESAIDYNNRGLMYFRNSQLNEAIADLTYAIQINPRLDSAYNNRANCYAAMGKLAEAIVDYDAAIDLNPANVRAWINQGITYRDLGLYDLAIENLEIALVMGKHLQGRIYAERGRSYYLRGDWNCANADYHRALKELSQQQDSNRSYIQKVNNWLSELLNAS